MIIGYSCWGFLGPGIADTPDGGRSHRRTLIDGLRARGHQIVFLQANRDLAEAGIDLTDTYEWRDGLPDLDALFLEWRWPILGRNTTVCGDPGHTCDLHRQQQLLDHYTAAGTVTVLWDKDRQLPDDAPLRRIRHVVVCEPALHPSPGAVSLLFPVTDTALDAADPVALAAGPRDVRLVYIGNQYDRDDAFDRYFAPAARIHQPHVIAGKWPRIGRWPELNFTGRIPFSQVETLYGRSIATVTLLPERYAGTGHMTQRLFEAVLAGCLPLVPTSIRDAHGFAPADLVVGDDAEVTVAVDELVKIAGSARHAELIADCVDRLDVFRLSRQLDVIDHLLAGVG
jgi:hypothetical protein